MNEKLRSVSYKEYTEWKQGWCLLVTGGMMSEPTVIVERKDGTIAQISIEDVQFNDRIFEREVK